MTISNALEYTRNALNYPGKLPASVPLVGGKGAGDLLVGESPEAISDYSHGFGPVKGKGHAFQLDKRLIDIAGLPLPYGVAAKGATMLGQRATGALLRGASDVSRRDFLKKGAAVAGAAAGAAAIPDIAKLGVKALEKPLAETAAAKAAPLVASNLARAGLVDSMVSKLTGWAAGKEGREWLNFNVSELTGPEFDHFVGNITTPEMKKVLADIIEDVPVEQVDPNLLHKLSTNELVNGGILDPRTIVYTRKLGGYGGREYYDWSRAMEAKLKTDPVFLKKFEDYIITGKLPAKATDEEVTALQTLGLADLPAHSRFEPFTSRAAKKYDDAIEWGIANHPEDY
jgi:hypothetical protein